MATTSGEKTIVSAQIPLALRLGLEKLAADGDRSLSAEVRRALSAHLHQHTDDGPPSAA
jgi:hypothetical protein